MVDGAMVYLKYFQKSKRALRLKREASTSSVKEKRKNETYSISLRVSCDKV